MRGQLLVSVGMSCHRLLSRAARGFRGDGEVRARSLVVGEPAVSTVIDNPLYAVVHGEVHAQCSGRTTP